MVTQQNGLPRSISEYQTKTLASMVHRVQTTHGVSTQTIERSSTNNMGGNSQGNGASGPDWHCTNKLAIPVYANFTNNREIIFKWHGRKLPRKWSVRTRLAFLYQRARNTCVCKLRSRMPCPCCWPCNIRWKDTTRYRRHTKRGPTMS